MRSALGTCCRRRFRARVIYGAVVVASGSYSGGREAALFLWWRCRSGRRAAAGCPSLYSEGVICRPSRGAIFFFRRLVPARGCPHSPRRCKAVRGRRAGCFPVMGLGMRRRGLCSDGSLPETVFARVAARRSQNDTQSRDTGTSTRETQRICNHLCRDSSITYNCSASVVAAGGTALR